MNFRPVQPRFQSPEQRLKNQIAQITQHRADGVIYKVGDIKAAAVKGAGPVIKKLTAFNEKAEGKGHEKSFEKALFS